MLFQEAFDIFKSFYRTEELRCTKDVFLKAELRNLIGHMDYGLCILGHLNNLATICENIKEKIATVNLAILRPRLADLTDARSGVGINNNHEVYYRIAQETLICNNYYLRVHLAP